jgi:transglutaminase-like putative cysteine protease
MRLVQIALVLIGLGTNAAVAAGPYWHRSAVLDYRVAADGTSTATEIWEVRADTNALAHTIAQQSYSFIADLERIELVAAYTQKRDGRRIKVTDASVMDQAVTTPASAPQFSAMVSRTIVFPQVAAGDTVHYELRRSTIETMFPGEFTLTLEPGGATTTERADISISLPSGRSMRTAVSGLDEAPVELGADGAAIRRWHLAPNRSGAVSLEASTFADYAALGRAYAARAWPQSRPGQGVRELADRLAPSGTGQRETVLRLYGYVASEIRYVAMFLGKGRVVPREAETILAEGWGDCKDHTALLQALLAAKGIEAKPALISLHNRYSLPDAPGLSALDHVITYVPALDLYLDSTAPYAPFGLLLANEYDKPVVLVGPQDARLGRTPPMSADGIVLTTRTTARIGDADVVSGRTTTVASGPQSIALRSMAAWFEGRGTAYSANSQLQQLGTPGTGRFAFESPENAGGDYRVEGRFTLDEKLLEGGTVPFQVPSGLGVFGRPGKLLLSAAMTEDGGHACYPGRELEETVLELPPGAHVLEAPRDVAIHSGGASYTATYTTEDGALHIRREFQVETATQLCGDAEFEAMRTVLNAARRDQQAQISLVRIAPQRVATGP